MSKRLVESVSFRFDKTVIDRLDVLAVVLRTPGREPVRAEAILATIYSGLEAFERDPGLIKRMKKRRSG